MNLHDAERVAGLLESCGCICVPTAEEADIVVFMTCCVRDNADQRLYGQASAMVSAPTPPSGRRVVCIGGCIAQRDGERVRGNIPCADVVFGTSALASLPGLIEEALASDGRPVEVDTVEEGRPFSTDLPSHRAQPFHAWVPIMTGCDNFCTYCIVPHVRGRERSRTMESIVSEVEALVADGVREVTLLGQNVNSYGRNIYGSPRFAELLRRVGETGVERIRFTSSNPKDLSDEVISAMAEAPAVMPHLHLAVQSGSTRVLRAMNRRYTREQYLDLVGRLRAAIPGLALSTDIIVGFPGETEEDFEETLSLVREAASRPPSPSSTPRAPGRRRRRCPTTPPMRSSRGASTGSPSSWHSRRTTPTRRTSEPSPACSSRRLKAGRLGPRWPQREEPDGPLRPSEGRSPEEYVGKVVDVLVDEARTWYLRGAVTGEPR